MMNRIATVPTGKRAIARPLKVLVPLIKTELAEANEAGLEHYRRAGEMLVEAKEQVAHGSWGRWLSKNFELSQNTAIRYMRLARRVESGDVKITPRGENGGLKAAIGEKPARAAWANVHHAADRVNVDRLAEERQQRDREIKLHRELALQLIDLGYRALATRLHPDRGGSRDAMSRLNLVRDELKSVAATRRFV
jgi:hypothetical protein